MTEASTPSSPTFWSQLPAYAQWVCLTIFIAAVYWLSGTLGQFMSVPPDNISVAWPPSGIALATVMLIKRRALAGIFIGALAANTSFIENAASTSELIIAAIVLVAIGLGSTLQPFLGHILIKRLIDNGDPLQNSKSVIKFAVLAPVFCVISSSIGSVSLFMSGLNDGAPLLFMWSTWWFGDTVGVLVFMPFVMSLLRQSSMRWFLLFALMAAGGGLTFYASSSIRQDATTVWENVINTEASRVTGVFNSRLFDLATPIESLATLFNNSGEVTEKEFWQALYLLEDYDSESVPTFVGYATQAEETTDTSAINEWNMQFSTDPAGPLRLTGNAIESSALLETIRAAHENRNVVIIGPCFADDRGRPIAVLALSAPTRGRDGVLVALINYSDIIDGMFTLEIPPGFALELSESSAAVEGYAASQTIWELSEPKSRDAFSIQFRSTVYRNQYSFNWVIDPEVYGEPATEFANVVLVGGTAASMLLTLLFAFMIAQNEKVSRQVDRRTQELQESEARSKSILDNSSVAAAITNPATGEIIYANQRMAEMVGVNVDQVLGRSAAEFYQSAEERDRVLSEFSKSGNIIDQDVMLKRDNGSPFNGLMSMSLISYMGTDCVMAWIFDITDRKALEESSRLQQKAISSSSNAISIVNYTGEQPYIESVNQALLDFMGLQEGDLVGKDPIKLVGEKTDPDVLKQAVDDILNHRNSSCILHLGANNGKDVWTSTSFSPVHNETGELTHYVNVSVDITERLRMEDELRESMGVATAAAQAKSDFLAAMSHEIRTPMNGVVGMIDLMSQTKLDSEQNQMLTTIRDSGHSLLTIINDILDFSKIEAGKLDIENIDMALTDLVEGAAQTVAANALKKHVSLVTYIDPNLSPFKKGDPTRVRQILINLTGNAIKFSDEGSTVQIRADKIEGEDGTAARVRFSIVDQGIGISEEAQKNLFQEFSQADMSTTRKFGGTGLGLAICKRLAEIMNGDIGVVSELGKGSTFWFELPLSASGKAREDRKVSDLSGLRVLVVSPSEVYREISRSYLSHWNADVEVITDIGECLHRAQDDQARGEPLDIIVVPDLDDHTKVADTRKAFTDAGLMPYPRFVIGEDPRNKDAILDGIEEVTMMDINPMRRAGLITAVAIAAGRASPEIDNEVDIEILENVQAPTVEEALTQGKLILLAEDNLTNQLVIRKQLNKLGYQCEIANDGKEGFEMWQQKAYCMLLTDCHMPEWDGFELTDAVRKSEESTDKRSPIVAITANALQGEAERCIAAGMDDYMSKPVEMTVLKQTLVKWMGDGGVAGGNTSSVKPSEESPAPSTKEEKGSASEGHCPIDERMLKDMFGDDDAMFKEIMQSFVDPTEGIIADLKTAFEDRSAADVKAQAHKLKSSSRSVGANELADTCLALETAGKEEDWAAIETLAPKVELLFIEVKAYVDAL